MTLEGNYTNAVVVVITTMSQQNGSKISRLSLLLVVVRICLTLDARNAATWA